MNFAHPLAFLLLLLLVPIALLYWRRVRAPRRTVGTGLFWQKALAEEKARWQWRRRRTQISVTIQVTIVVLLTLAAAGPQIPASKRIVLIIDNSATMRATDVPPTRLEAAKKAARRMIESLRSCDEMAVIEVGPAPIEIQPLTSDRQALASAVDAIQATTEPATIDWAVKLAGEIRGPGEDRLKPGLRAPQIVLITDACSKECRTLDNGVKVWRVGTEAGNLAITGFSAQRSRANPAQCEVFAEVRCQGNPPAKPSVTITSFPSPSGSRSEGEGDMLPSPSGRGAGGEGGLPIASAPLSFDKDGRYANVFTVDLPKAARLVARISPDDAYIFDDVAKLDVPAAPAVHRVKLVCDDRSCLKEILKGNPRVELIPDDSQAKAIQVIDGNTPGKLPDGPALIFSPRNCDLWQLGEKVPDLSVDRVDDDSPVVAGAWLYNTYLPEARELEIVDSVREHAKPILWAGTKPLGYTIDRKQGRVVVIAGNMADSNLALQRGFPTLVAQALDWLDGQPTWKDEVFFGRGEMGPIGLISPISSSSTYGQVNPGATDLGVPNDIGSEAAELVVKKPWPPPWLFPAALAAVLAIIEWCLYQRRWTS